MLVLRLGHTAPDFMFTWNVKDVLPLEFLEPISTKPGPINPDICAMVSPRHGGKPTKEFHVDPKCRTALRP